MVPCQLRNIRACTREMPVKQHKILLVVMSGYYLTYSTNKTTPSSIESWRSPRSLTCRAGKRDYVLENTYGAEGHKVSVTVVPRLEHLRSNRFMKALARFP
jgi:hypothetical protein